MTADGKCALQHAKIRGINWNFAGISEATGDLTTWIESMELSQFVGALSGLVFEFADLGSAAAAETEQARIVLDT